MGWEAIADTDTHRHTCEFSINRLLYSLDRITLLVLAHKIYSSILCYSFISSDNLHHFSFPAWEFPHHSTAIIFE